MPRASDCVRDRLGIAAVDEGLTSDHERRPLCLAKKRRDFLDVRALVAWLRRKRFARRRDEAHVRLIELTVQMAAHVELEGLGAEILGVLDPALAHEHLPNHFFGVEHVDGHFDEDGTRDPALRQFQGPLDRRSDAVDLLDRHGPFGDRLHQRNLVDVLKCAAPLEQSCGRATEDQKRRLRQLGVFHGGDRVRHARAGGHRSDSGDARHARDRVGREHGADLVANIDHLDTMGLRANENG